jgi:hypothetical protein
MARKPIHPFLYKIADIMKEEFEEPAPIWLSTEIEPEEMEKLKTECTTYSAHDPHHLRLSMCDRIMMNKAVLVSVECEYGRLIAAFETYDQIDDLPLELWGRILRLFTKRKETTKPYRVFFLANSMVRKMPAKNEKIGPGNINGGYTYPCDQDMIMIYRAEDATRVLIHELFHSSCTDKSDDVDTMESETEAWAELFYCGFISRGVIHVLRDWVARQSDYMNKQNRAVAKVLGDRGVVAHEFPWRYTLGKQIVWERWGIFEPDKMIPEIKVGDSLRLTLAPPSVVKKRENIRENSIIL